MHHLESTLFGLKKKNYLQFGAATPQNVLVVIFWNPNTNTGLCLKLDQKFPPSFQNDLLFARNQKSQTLILVSAHFNFGAGFFHHPFDNVVRIFRASLAKMASLVFTLLNL